MLPEKFKRWREDVPRRFPSAASASLQAWREEASATRPQRAERQAEADKRFGRSQPLKMPTGLSSVDKRMFNEKSAQAMQPGQAKVPDLAFTIHAATRGMNEQDRRGYIQQFRDRMASRLERYEWRKAKGVDLTNEQKQIYDQLLNNVQVANQMMEAPQEMTQYMEGAGALVGQRLGVDYGEPIYGRESRPLEEFQEERVPDIY